MVKFFFTILLFFTLLQGEELSSHPGLRTIDSVGFLGSSVTLDDGSIWTVKPSDRALVRDWRDLKFKEVILIPNEGWILGTHYPFCLVNLFNEVSIEVRMEQPPEGDKCSYITFIDHANSLLEVVDSMGNETIWHITRWDRTLLSEWEAGDTVMVGGNVRWNKSINPYILFNLKREGYIRGMVYLQD